jgi:hypothetical protein
MLNWLTSVTYPVIALRLSVMDKPGSPSGPAVPGIPSTVLLQPENSIEQIKSIKPAQVNCLGMD